MIIVLVAFLASLPAGSGGAEYTIVYVPSEVPNSVAFDVTEPAYPGSLSQTVTSASLYKLPVCTSTISEPFRSIMGGVLSTNMFVESRLNSLTVSSFIDRSYAVMVKVALSES